MSPYLIELKSAIALMPEHIYGGVGGRRRLAREIGGSLADSNPEDAEKDIGVSYDVLLMGTALNPILDKKEWDSIVREAYTKEVSRRKEVAE